LGDLPADLSLLTALTRLNLIGLEVRSEAHAAVLGGIESLRELQLSHWVPPSISRLTALTALSYTRAAVRSIASAPAGAGALNAICGCTSLVSLSLSQVSNLVLPAAFTRLQQLACLQTCSAGPLLNSDVILALPALTSLTTDWELLHPSTMAELEGRGVRVLMVSGDAWRHLNYESYDWDLPYDDF
jgi:hypothetical protein